MAHESFHEDPNLLSEETRNMHRAIISLIEELEAIDWYQQRADACSDDALKAILVHNKNEEIEHAMMTLEWIRRRSTEVDANVKTYLNTEGPITEIEEETTGGDSSATQGSKDGGDAVPRGTPTSSLGIGSLRRAGIVPTAGTSK